MIKNRRFQRVHKIVYRALLRGDITKPTLCEMCGDKLPSRKIHAHHQDHRKPLAVRWLCAVCHGREHHSIEVAYQRQPRNRFICAVCGWQWLRVAGNPGPPRCPHDGCRSRCWRGLTKRQVDWLLSHGKSVPAPRIELARKRRMYPTDKVSAAARLRLERTMKKGDHGNT